MTWQEVRRAHPDRWLVFEATAARSEAGRRIVDAIRVVVSVDDAHDVMKRYLELHGQEPAKELYVAHTSRETLRIEERRWVGVRPRWT